MPSTPEPIITTPTDQVSVTVVRKSDGKAMTFVMDEKTHLHELKAVLKKRLTPQHEHGCRLIFREKVMKGKHSLKHYGIRKGVNDQSISSKFKQFQMHIGNKSFSSIKWMIQNLGNLHRRHYHLLILNNINNNKKTLSYCIDNHQYCNLYFIDFIEKMILIKIYYPPFIS